MNYLIHQNCGYHSSSELKKLVHLIWFYKFLVDVFHVISVQSTCLADIILQTLVIQFILTYLLLVKL